MPLEGNRSHPSGKRQNLPSCYFLVMLKRKDKELPYFALWVDNAELLVPFKGEIPDEIPLGEGGEEK